jgi:dipeptidyl aminopeptidase/acylaminoacyl peptidase
MFAGKWVRAAFAVVAVGGMTVCGWAQQGKQLTMEDYAHAEKFMNYNVNPLVYHGVDRVTWLPDGRFWYGDLGPEGVTYEVVNPQAGTKAAAFDQGKLAAALTAAEKNEKGAKPYDAKHLRITELAFEDGGKTALVTAAGAKMRCELGEKVTCTEVPAAKGAQTGGRARGGMAAISPDKTKRAFIRDWNLWVADVATGKETQLTTDGVKDFGYATDNAGWTHSDRPILVWSPDSKKIATFQQDQRKTGELYLVPVTNGHPKLVTLKYPLVGDENVTMIERVVIDVDHPKVVRLKMPPDQHRSTLCDDVSCYGGWEDVQWSADSTKLAFVSTSRDHKQEWVRLADVATGDVHEVMTEKAAKFFESGNGRVNWKYLSKTNELLWFSERDGWGQMYLYDMATGKLKNQITHGEGNVTEVLHVDEPARTLYYLAVGKEAGRDPYYQHLYRIGFDGSGLKLLTPEDADHVVTLSDDGKYFVDVASTPVQPQTTVVRDDSGKLVMEVAKQDITKLVAMGWQPLTQIKVKARDGKTELYGFMFKPTTMEPGVKYPIVNYVYPGPQIGSCGGREFTAAHHDLQALAELGFVVVCIDGMGTPYRSKAFHEAYFGNLGDDTIPDQVSGMEDLAKQYNFIDLERAGMFGHSGGGNATASAMFHFPDFFKVGISESGNHDNRDYEDDWAEKWAGLEVKQKDGTSNYDSQANQNYAKNLKGHLLLAHGTMDDNVPMNNTLIVVDALIKANKDFDLLLIPNVPHGYGAASQYMMRRRWDYFVRYLAGNTPPKEYLMKPWPQVMSALGMGPSNEDDSDAASGTE